MQEFIDIKELGNHYVFFADDLGIASIFPSLKHRLAELKHQHTSLFYCSLNHQHSFERELEILQKYFPARFFLSYHSRASEGCCNIEQKDVEAVLNANTMTIMKFIISGNETFVEDIKATLLFLGITHIQIHEQFFSE
jgi:ferredoxin-NADP reductase